MKRIFPLALAAAVSLSLLAGCGPKEPPAVSTPSGSQSQQTPESSQETPSEPSAEFTAPSGELKLKKFKHIQVSALSPDIRIERGKGWSVRYTLHNKEQITRAEVADDTFYFSSGFQMSPGMDLKDFELVITIPDDAQLEDVDLKTAAGTIELSGLTLDELDAESVSGNVKLSDLVCKSMDAETVSGDVVCTNCTAGEAKASSTSGGVRLEGSFEDAELYSVSGSCELYAQIQQEAKLQTVSGPIKAQAPVEKLEIQSLGAIVVDGQKQRGKNVTVGEGSPVLTIESVSGTVSADRQVLIAIQ